jgi:hypothetical protein
MEEDDPPPQHERLGDGESFSEPLPVQYLQDRVSEPSQKTLLKAPVNQDAPKNPFSRLPRTVIEQ